MAFGRRAPGLIIIGLLYYLWLAIEKNDVLALTIDIDYYIYALTLNKY